MDPMTAFVLVIDDDPSTRAALDELVGSVGLTVQLFASPQDMLDAIHAARRQQALLVAELRERYATLTERERQIMTGVVVGRRNKQIAAELNLSEITVKVHRAHAMRKMQAGSLPELVRFADRLAQLSERLTMASR